MNATYNEQGLGKLLSLATVRARTSRSAACCGQRVARAVRLPAPTARTGGCSRAGYLAEYKKGAGSCPWHLCGDYPASQTFSSACRESRTRLVSSRRANENLIPAMRAAKPGVLLASLASAPAEPDWRRQQELSINVRSRASSQRRTRAHLKNVRAGCRAQQLPTARQLPDHQ